MAPHARANVPFVVANLTNRCNLRCGHCCYGSGTEGKQLDAAVWGDALEALRKIGCCTVGFTGGEPLLYPGIADLARFAYDLGYSVKMNSNGTLVTRQVAAWMRAVEVFEMRIGLDGPAPETHDRVRGKGSFTKALQGCKNLAEAGVPIAVNTTVGRHNLEVVGRMIENARDAGACHVHFYPWQAIGRGVGMVGEELDDAAKRRLVAAASETTPRLPVLESPAAADVPCGDAWIHLMLWPDGSVVPHVCVRDFSSHVDTVLTNISEPGFAGVVQRFLAETASSLHSCSDCRWRRSPRCRVTNACCVADAALA